MDETGLLGKLEAHGVDLTLVDDRTSGFAISIIIGYTRHPAEEHPGVALDT